MKKRYNCPDCKVTEDSCDGCQRYCDSIKGNSIDNKNTYHLEDLLKLMKIETLPVKYPDDPDFYNYDYTTGYNKKYNDIPSCCINCPNHPKNGGSGVCNCTAPYFCNDSLYKITC